MRDNCLESGVNLPHFIAVSGPPKGKSDCAAGDWMSICHITDCSRWFSTRFSIEFSCDAL